MFYSCNFVCVTYIADDRLSCTDIVIANILSISYICYMNDQYISQVVPTGARPCSLGSFHTSNIMRALQHDMTMNDRKTIVEQISAI